jgi:hypothetical protein
MYICMYSYMLGYAPISGRLVQLLGAPGGWSSPYASEALRLLPGPTIEINQRLQLFDSTSSGASASASVTEELEDAISRWSHCLCLISSYIFC